MIIHYDAALLALAVGVIVYVFGRRRTLVRRGKWVGWRVAGNVVLPKGVAPAHYAKTRWTRIDVNRRRIDVNRLLSAWKRMRMRKEGELGTRRGIR